MIYFIYLLIVFYIMMLFILRYVSVRNNRVFEFRMMILGIYGCDGHDQLPSYNEMVFSFKKLTIENYLPHLLSHESGDEKQ